MAIGADGFRMSHVGGCVEGAGTYGLSVAEARAIVDHQIEVIRDEWREVTELAQLTQVEQLYFWRRQFLNPYSVNYAF